MIDAMYDKDSELNAILLIGPTGAGKTPLGEYLDINGLWGRRCFHFDFGANLRAVAASSVPSTLTVADMVVVRESLSGGTLLENEHFYIAARILADFVDRCGIGGGDLLLLNGLPRHVGQATDVDSLVSIGMVISLNCSVEIVRARIGGNTGGDRSERVDDSATAIGKKLAVFRSRTTPLLDHYRSKGVQIAPVEVGVDTTPQEITVQLPGTPAGCDWGQVATL